MEAITGRYRLSSPGYISHHLSSFLLLPSPHRPLPFIESCIRRNEVLRALPGLAAGCRGRIHHQRLVVRWALWCRAQPRPVRPTPATGESATAVLSASAAAAAAAAAAVDARPGRRAAGPVRRTGPNYERCRGWQPSGRRQPGARASPPRMAGCD